MRDGLPQRDRASPYRSIRHGPRAADPLRNTVRKCIKSARER
jgi:hypothetical protein